MDFEQLKAVLDVLGSASDKAMWVAIAYFGFSLLKTAIHSLAVVGVAWLFGKGVGRFFSFMNE